MADSDPNLIVRLLPLNERTRIAWKNPHNSQFYVPASFKDFEERENSSRATTPLDDEIDSQEDAPDSEAELRLTLNDFPKDIAAGFVFGRSKKVCDIYCGERSSDFNITVRAFSITVNAKGQAVLKYLTPNSTISVKYGN